MVVKTGVALPDVVYKQLNELAKEMGYASISKVIRDAVELFIAFNRWWVHSGPLSGVLLLIVDESVQSSLLNLQEVEREFHDVVKFSVRLRPAGGYLAQVLVVQGSGSRVKELYKALQRVRGVLCVQAALVPLPESRAEYVASDTSEE